MLNKKLSKIFCDFCYSSKNVVYNIYRIKVITNKMQYDYGIEIFLERFSSWCMKKGYHLSASQILLMRPDIVVNYFEELKPNEIIKRWKFVPFYVCLDCYEEYKKQVPLI